MHTAYSVHTYTYTDSDGYFSLASLHRPGEDSPNQLSHHDKSREKSVTVARTFVETHDVIGTSTSMGHRDRIWRDNARTGSKGGSERVGICCMKTGKGSQRSCKVMAGRGGVTTNIFHRDRHWQHGLKITCTVYVVVWHQYGTVVRCYVTL